MKKYISRLVLMLTALFMAFGPTLTEVAANSEANEFIIVHTNDMHGQMDPKVQELAYLKAYADEVDALAIFDAGDAAQGLPLNNITKGARMGKIMETIKFDAMAIGNHEFDYNQETVLGIQDGFFKSSEKLPKLGTNVYFNADSEFGDAGEPVFKESLVLNKNHKGTNISMSVFGLSTPETYVKADPRHSEGIDFQDPLPALMKELEKAEHQDTDYIVVLAHLGTDRSTLEKWRGDYVAEQLSKDESLKDRKIIFIDGHSHSHYKDGMTFGNNVLYGQTGSSLNNVGTMRINLDDFSKSVVQTVPMKDGYNLHADMAKLTANEEVVTQLLDASTEFDELTKEVILENLPVRLVGDRTPARYRETNLGNLIADSMWEYALDTFDNRTDLAVMNGGGIRANIEPGKVTLKEIITVMPYGNRVVQIDVVGSDILAMFEHGLTANAVPGADGELPTLDTNPALLHASDSVRLEFDPRREAGKRVQKLEIMDENGQMQALDLNKTYRLATLEFLAVGGDGFTMLGGARNEGGNDADIFADHLRNMEASDFDAYKDELSPYRVLPKAYAPIDGNDALVELYAKFEDLHQIQSEKTLYTDETWAEIMTVDALVENLLGKITGESLDGVTEEEYNRVLTEGHAAIDALLMNVEPAKVYIQEVMSEADDILAQEEIYTEASYLAVKFAHTNLDNILKELEALESSRATVGIDRELQDRINEGVVALNTAVSEAVTVLDDVKLTLQTLKEDVELKIAEKELYTAESFEVLETAYEQLDLTIQKLDNATELTPELKTEVDTVIADVRLALASLVLIDDVEPSAEVIEARVALAELKAEVNDVLAHSELYTQETLDALVLASEHLDALITKVNGVTTFDDVLRSEYDTVTKEVRTALDAMTLIDGTKPKDKTDPKKPNTGIASANIVLPVSIGLIALASIVFLRKKKTK